jgi:hypothetical protein
MKKFYYLLLVFLFGCETPVHYFKDSVSLKPDQLATVALRGNEIKLLELNDKKYTGEQSQHDSYIYLTPGKYKFTAMLTWIDLFPMGSGISFTVNTHSQYLRTGCLNLEAGVYYNFFARNPGNDWIFVVSNEKTGSSNYKIVPEC